MTLDKIDPDELGEPAVTMVSTYENLFIQSEVKIYIIVFQVDMLGALETQKAAVGQRDLVKYQEFTQTFGQEGS